MIKKAIYTGLLLITTLVATIWGIGLAYPHYLLPTSSNGTFNRISTDGWISDGATITLNNLSKRGNRLQLNFNSWHPNDNYPHYQISVCGKLAGDFIAPPSSSHEISLNGECEPRVVSFKVLNPYTTESDSRMLGSQLSSAVITSRLGTVIADKPLILSIFLALLILVVFSLQLSHPYLTLFIPFLSIPILCYIGIGRIDKLLACWFFALAFLVGIKNCNLKNNKLVLNESLLIYVAVILGALLRFYGLDFGLPRNYHPDEVPKFNAITNMIVNGDLNPHYFKHPSLLLYSAYFISRIFCFFGIVTEHAANSSSVIILSGRIASAITGTFSIYLTYKIGKYLFSPKAAVIAAYILAFLPLHVTCSRYMKEDVILTCMVLLTTTIVLKAVAKDSKRLLLLAGFFAGVAASSKYSGMLAAAIICAAPWLHSKSFKPTVSYFIPTILALVMMPIGFVVCTPYSILDNQKFLIDFNSEKNHMVRGHDVAITPWAYLWLYHLNKSIIPGMTVLPAFLGLAGLFTLVRRFKIPGLYLVALFLLFYLPAEFVNAKPAPQPERYIIPCLPFLALSAAIFIDTIQSRVVRIVLTSLLIILPCARSYALARDIKYDTRDRMKDWMNMNLPKKSRVALFWKNYAGTYGRGRVIQLKRDAVIPTLQDVDKIDADYLLLSTLTYGRYFDQLESSPINRVVIRKLFNELPIIHEEEAASGRYGFNNPKLTLFSLRKDTKLSK